MLPGEMTIMEEWELIFGKVQNLSRSVRSTQDGLKDITAFARGNAALFDEPDYWKRAENHDFRPAETIVRSWAAAGLESLTRRNGWEFLLLDLGDCPETFRLYSPGGQDLMSEQKFRTLMLNGLLIGCGELETCFSNTVAAPFDLLFGLQRIEYADHNVSELDDPLVNWRDDQDTDDEEISNDHGWNGYLLWLAVGSLALVDQLRDPSYCNRILRGRERIYLLAGYEEIFFYLATITPTGLQFEEAER